MRWLKSLVGLRKVERQQQQQRRKEDGDAGRTVRGTTTSTYLRFRLCHFVLTSGFLNSFWSTVLILLGCGRIIAIFCPVLRENSLLSYNKSNR